MGGGKKKKKTAGEGTLGETLRGWGVGALRPAN